MMSSDVANLGSESPETRFPELQESMKILIEDEMMSEKLQAFLRKTKRSDDVGMLIGTVIERVDIGEVHQQPVRGVFRNPLIEDTHQLFKLELAKAKGAACLKRSTLP